VDAPLGLLPAVGRRSVCNQKNPWAIVLDPVRAVVPGKPPLRQFHLAPCRNGVGEFAGYSQAERDHAEYRFETTGTQ